MSHHEQQEKEFSLKNFFVPLTTLKVVHIIAMVGIIVFFNALFNPFILDDLLQIVSSPYIHNISLIPDFFIGSSHYPGIFNFKFLYNFYRPIPFTLYTLLYSAFGSVPFPFHLLQLLIHITNSFLIYLILTKFFKRYAVALILALIFLIHPLNSETTIYISNLQDTLFMFFGLIAFYGFIKIRSSLISYKKLLLLTFFILLSLFSKESGILFLFIILFYSFLYSKINIKRLIIAFFFCITIYTLFRVIASNLQLWIVEPSLIHKAPFVERAQSIPSILLYYISHFLFPIHMATGQEWVVKQIDLENFYIPFLIDLFFFVVLFYCGTYINKKSKIYFKLFIFFVIWFCLGLLLHIQLKPLDLIVADRWFYFPIVGLLGMIGVFYVCLETQINNIHFKKIVFITSTLFIIPILSILTMIRNAQWQDPVQLFSHDITYSSDSPLLNNNLGVSLANSGELDKAIPYLEKALKLDPSGGYRGSLGQAYEHKKNFKKAKAIYLEDIKINNNSAKYISYYGLARIYIVYDKKPQEALSLVKYEIQKYPYIIDLLKAEAIAEYQMGDKEAALKTMQKILTYAPNQNNQQVYLFIQNNNLSPENIQIYLY